MKNFVKNWLGGASPDADQPKPRVEPGHRVYCIGDIHGRLDLLRQLHGMIEEDGESWEGDRVLVYLGDYIDRGMHSSEVIDELLVAPLAGFDNIYLMGNHEQTLLDFLLHPKVASGWLAWGGRETLASYGIHMQAHVRPDPERLRDELQSQLPARHLEFYRGAQMMHVSGDYLFVHAGIRPGKPLQEQSNADLLWIRDDFTESSQLHEHVVVHGHTISKEVVFLPNRIGIDTGAYSTGILTCLVLEGEEQRLLQTEQEQ